ncbi:hypothetical protein ARMSODRAFT_887680, partial [Armillaria solidipes]
VIGALNESFSKSQLETWAPNFLHNNEFNLGIDDQSGPNGAMKDTAKYASTLGIIAAGMENGELALCDPAKICAGVGETLMKNPHRKVVQYYRYVKKSELIVGLCYRQT